MSNSASKKQCKLKRELSTMTNDYSNHKTQELIHEFYKGPIRYGNKRHCEAEIKVKDRRSKRMKEKEETNKIIKDNE